MIDISEGDEDLSDPPNLQERQRYATEDPARNAARQIRSVRRSNRAKEGKDALLPLERRKAEKAALAQHSSNSSEHYTPPDIVEACRWLMGSIDLDPATSWLANQTIKADTFYEVNGLVESWGGNVFLNPPGGDTAKVAPSLKGMSRSYPCIWWSRLVSEWLAGNVKQACFMIFQLNLLQSVQKMEDCPQTFFNFPMVFFRERIRFYYPEDTMEGLPVEGTKVLEGASPPGGSALVYLPPKGIREVVWWENFREAFKLFGAVK